MREEILKQYNKFRELCLINSEDAIRTAEYLLDKNVNHIAYNLSVLALEEIGKIFIGWYQLDSTDGNKDDKVNIPLDDNVKKLFWSIWGPTLTIEKITKRQINEIKVMATNIHNKRLNAMYTELDDTIPSSMKINDDEIKRFVKMTRTRLEMEKSDDDLIIDESQKDDMAWFMEITKDKDKENFIFGNISQDKLIEFGNLQAWYKWLKEHFDKEEKELKEIIDKELQKEINQSNDTIPKWKLSFRVISSSHSIRDNILKLFDNKMGITLKKGSDNNTLIINVLFDNRILIKEIWDQGWTFCKLFVAALNVGSTGSFYWNLVVDRNKYYDQIIDLENNKRLAAIIEIDTQEQLYTKKPVLGKEEIALSFLTLKYFSKCLSSDNFIPVNYYIMGLGILAKIDIHLRFEPEAFLQFFMAFKTAIQKNEDCQLDFNVKEIGYAQIEKLILDKDEFYRVIDIGTNFLQSNNKQTQLITLNEVRLMKLYNDFYFITLAARDKYGDHAILYRKE